MADYTSRYTGEEIDEGIEKANSALQEHQDISHKVDKIEGKGLSTNDFTNELKNKLENIPTEGIQGPQGESGKSAYQIWLDNGNTGTETDYLNSLKGAKGDKGETGVQGLKGDKGDVGPKGDTPVKGVDYFTENDIDQIAETAATKVNIPTKVSELTNDSGFLTEVELTPEQLDVIADKVAEAQQIKVVDSVEQMVDTSKNYVNSQTGTIWAYETFTTEVTTQETVRIDIEGTSDNPYHNNSRLGSSADVINNDAANNVVTPLIDFTDLRFVGKEITLHLAGLDYFPTASPSPNYTMNRAFKPDGSVINARNVSIYPFNSNSIYSAMHNATFNKYTQVSEEHPIVPEFTMTFTPYMLYGSADVEIGKVRFATVGNSADSSIYITYKDDPITETVVTSEWRDTGVAFGGSGASVDQETLDKIASLNNEGSDPSTIKLLSQPVLDFYNKPAYSANDYTTSYLSKKTYPFRADIPVPYNIKWNHNENAMRTFVAYDTRAITDVSVNAYNSPTKKMMLWDATGRDSFPIYNLIPSTTYYYYVSHVMADGSVVEAKRGSFTTSSEKIRQIYIEGTQNVRDLGGWTGLDGRVVKYGKLFRGASFSDSSYPGLMLGVNGRLSLAELNIQAEVNLGAIDTSTSIASNCAYRKFGYSNYSAAILDTQNVYKTMFKSIFEYILSCLDGSLQEGILFHNINRNVYFHCQGGCDRTGTLSFLLLGLLGVSESDLAKEYELSSFSDIGLGRLRNTVKATDGYDYRGMVEAVKANYSGTTLADKIYDYATTGCGIDATKITEFRNIMLG